MNVMITHDVQSRTKVFTHDHSVIDALALGRHWRFWLKKRGGGGGGGGKLQDFGDKGGGSQMVDHKKMQGVCKF